MISATIWQHRLTTEELAHLDQLRGQSPAQNVIAVSRLGLGDRVSDRLAAIVGSWYFIIIQSLLLALWIVLNAVGWIAAWDPYPFILLDLALSFQAACTAPIIMMSQNRQAAVDRHNAENDYKINCKAEPEIELLHQKTDLLREREVHRLVGLVSALEQRFLDQSAENGEAQ